MHKEVTYTIQQVAQKTGLSKQVIRKWETRYNVIQPARLANGYRTYTEAELTILQRTQQFVKDGYTIAEAAERAKQTMLSASQPFSTLTAHDFLQALESVGARADEQQLMQLLHKAHHTLGLLTMIDTVIVPFLLRVGQLWCDRTWTEYQEAISSQTIRDFLANARRQIFVAEDAPLIIGSCLPEERHEIPMQLLLLRCALTGYKTLMLGPAPAPRAIEQAVQQKLPIAILLSVSTSTSEAILAPLERFARTTDVPFFLGGHGTDHLPISLTHIHVNNHLHSILNKIATVS